MHRSGTTFMRGRKGEMEMTSQTLREARKYEETVEKILRRRSGRIFTCVPAWGG